MGLIVWLLVFLVALIILKYILAELELSPQLRGVILLVAAVLFLIAMLNRFGGGFPL